MGDELEPESEQEANQMAEAFAAANELMKRNRPVQPRNRAERRAMQRQMRRKPKL
jgi:hypothetical protein